MPWYLNVAATLISFGLGIWITWDHFSRTGVRSKRIKQLRLGATYRVLSRPINDSQRYVVVDEDLNRMWVVIAYDLPDRFTLESSDIEVGSVAITAVN